MHPGKVDPSRLPLDSIQDLHTTGTPPEVDLNRWRLVVTREKEELLSLPFRRIIRMETVKKKVLLICPGWFADYAEWEGVPLSELLSLAGVGDEYRRIVFHGMDGYSSSFDREEVRENFLYLAHRVNGECLPLEHGFPLRLVAEDVLGGRWVKWVSRIEVR
jgi:sulfoxide reductase catalytic subunit YedY